MAKNKVYSQINQYANREEEIRKAKGNPNKNNHAKKKNSNYGGYSTSAGSYMAQKLAERGKQQERVKLPMWLNITPVSYTHLDVYKRQSMGCLNWLPLTVLSCISFFSDTSATQ